MDSLISIQYKYADLRQLNGQIIYLRPLCINGSDAKELLIKLYSYFSMYDTIIGIEIYKGFSYIVFSDKSKAMQIACMKFIYCIPLSPNKINISVSNKSFIKFNRLEQCDPQLDIIIKNLSWNNAQKIINMYITIKSSKLEKQSDTEPNNENICCICCDNIANVKTSCLCLWPRICIYCSVRLLSSNETFNCPICREKLIIHNLHII